MSQEEKLKEKFKSTLSEIQNKINDIEEFEGQAYQMFDEIGLSIHDIKVVIARTLWEIN